MNWSNFTTLDLAVLYPNARNSVTTFSKQFFLFTTLFCYSIVLCAQGTFFVSSNNQQAVGVFEVAANGVITENTFRNITADADGIFYDMDSDILYQLNRNNGAVAAYGSVKATLATGGTPSLIGQSAAETINGREIAVSGNRMVVAQDANEANGNQNRLIVFDVDGSMMSLSGRYDVDFNLWGIHVDQETLYAIEDNSNRLAVIDNFFFAPEGKINPTQLIAVEGIVRTHGLTYIADRDIMILTDVGAASSPDDGAVVVVMNYKAAAMDGIITTDEQTRIAGSNTLLGNPVDVAFDKDRDMIYVAERANGGGRVLSFPLTANGNVSPNYNSSFMGASAIHFPGTENETPFMFTRLAQVFASSNTLQKVGIYNIWSGKGVSIDAFNNLAQDADGIYYDRNTDALYQVNRMNNSVAAFSNVNASLQQGVMPPLTAISSAEFSNGRELAISGDILVVAQDANDANGNQNALVWFNYSPTSITFMGRLEVDFNLWGIHADGNTLYAIEDNSNRLAIFDGFFNTEAANADIILPFFVEIEGIVRTHGLTYIPERDMMLLTDVGAASSPDDGAFSIVKNFKSASADGFVSLDEQIRVEGDGTFLGNPVDIAFESSEMTIYVAERANGGGRILGYCMPSESGNFAPFYNDLFAGASAVHLSPDDGMGITPPTSAVDDRFFVSSNTQRVIAVYNIQDNNSIMKQHFVNANMDADGIYYDKNLDKLYQVNRIGNAVNEYSNVNDALDRGVMPMQTASSAAEFTNGRELAVSGDWLVVAQDGNDGNGNQNRLVIFDRSNNLALQRKIDVSFNLWGIHAEGADLYAIEDNSNRLRIYYDFFNQVENDIQIPLEVVVENLVRTHGITYDASRDIMYLTDVGAASSPDDGAIVIVNNFNTASADGLISAAEQIRIAGDATFLGNPVDIAYDGQRSMVYVAERANGGGRVLGFATPATSGNIAPIYNDLHAGASAIFFADGDGNNFVPPVIALDAVKEIKNTQTPNTLAFKVYPNPATDFLTLELSIIDVKSASSRTVAIYDAFGKEIRQINPVDLQQNIDVSNLASGIYYIMIAQGNQLTSQKFIKTE